MSLNYKGETGDNGFVWLFFFSIFFYYLIQLNKKKLKIGYHRIFIYSKTSVLPLVHQTRADTKMDQKSNNKKFENKTNRKHLVKFAPWKEVSIVHKTFFSCMPTFFFPVILWQTGMHASSPPFEWKVAPADPRQKTTKLPNNALRTDSFNNWLRTVYTLVFSTQDC